MPNIRFTKDAKLDEATENGGRRTVEIKAGTIQYNVSEGTAARWERRGVAERFSDITAMPAPALGAHGGAVITQAGPGPVGGAPSMPPVPPPPPAPAPVPPSPEDIERQAMGNLAPPPPPVEQPAAPVRRGRPNANPVDGDQGNGDGQS